MRFREKSLWKSKNLWKSPDLSTPPTSQSDPRPKSPDLTLRNLWSTKTIGTNQELTQNPSKESDQSDIPLPRNPFFHVYSLYKQCNPKPGAPPYSRCRCQWEPQLELGNKNSLAFVLDIGSLVVIGRFRDLGITFWGLLRDLPLAPRED